MSVRRALGWSYAGQATTTAIQFSTTIVLARILSPYDFGVFAAASGVAAIIAIFATFNVGAFVVREREATREVLRSAMTANFLFAALLALALLAAAAIAWRVADQPEIAGVIALLAAATLVATVDFVPATLMHRDMRIDFNVRIAVIRAFVVAIVTLVAAFEGWKAVSFGFGSLAGAIASAGIYAATCWRRMVFRPSFDRFREIVVFGLQLMSSGGVAQLAQRVTDLVLGAVLGLAALGLYSRASTISHLIFANLYGAATSVVFARMSREMRETGQLRSVFLPALSMITGVMWPFVIGVAILAGPAITILYGPQWTAAAPALTMLMIAQFIGFGFGMNWEVFVLREKTALLTKYEFIRAIVGTLAFTLGSFVSITAAAAGRIVEVFTGYLLYRPNMDRLVDSRPGEIERIYVENLLLTVAATWPSFALMLAHGWSPDTPPYLIAAAVAIGIGCWLVTIWLRRHPLLDEMARLLGRHLPARIRRSADEV